MNLSHEKYCVKKTDCRVSKSEKLWEWVMNSWLVKDTFKIKKAKKWWWPFATTNEDRLSHDMNYPYPVSICNETKGVYEMHCCIGNQTNIPRIIDNESKLKREIEKSIKEEKSRDPLKQLSQVAGFHIAYGKYDDVEAFTVEEKSFWNDMKVKGNFLKAGIIGWLKTTFQALLFRQAPGQDLPRWAPPEQAEQFTLDYIQEHMPRTITDYENTEYGSQQTDESVEAIVFRGLGQHEIKNVSKARTREDRQGFQRKDRNHEKRLPTKAEVDALGAHFAVDASYLNSFEVRKDFDRYGAIGYFSKDRKLLAIWHCEYNGDGGAMVFPFGKRRTRTNSKATDQEAMLEDYMDWEHAKWTFKSSLAAWLFIYVHLIEVHFTVAGSMTQALRETLPGGHPLRQFLRPFTFGTLDINWQATKNLISDGGAVQRVASFTFKEARNIIKSYPKTQFKYEDFDTWVERKGLTQEDEEDLPLIQDGRKLWKAMKTFAGKYGLPSEDVKKKKAKKLGEESTTGNATFLSVSVGEYHTCGITSSGALECFGSNVRERVSEEVSKVKFEAAALDMFSKVPCVDGVFTPVTATDVQWFESQDSSSVAQKLFTNFTEELGKISRDIDLRNANDNSRNFNAFNPKVLELSMVDSRVHIVTGANAGLGFASAEALARRGATVVMGCRSLKRCDQAAARIRDGGSNGLLRVELLDLGSLASVRHFSERFLAAFDRLDGLMLNAGVMHTPYQMSVDNLELQFAVNHVGHQYLARFLLPRLQATGSSDEPARVVSVSSNAAFMAYGSRGVRLSREEINRADDYNSIKAYGQSKLAQILFTKELQRRLLSSSSSAAASSSSSSAPVVAVALNPGAVQTELPRQWLQGLPGWYAGIFMKSYAFFTRLGFVWDAKTAALTQLWGATSPAAKEHGGAYLVPLARVGEPPVQARNATLCKELFDFTDALIDEALRATTAR
eukprot:g2140.t1